MRMYINARSKYSTKEVKEKEIILFFLIKKKKHSFGFKKENEQLSVSHP